VARIIHTASKASYGCGLSTNTVNSTLSEILKVQNKHSDELYKTMDALGERQQEIEQSLA
jgi:hypothetical protein